jgi:hypothetical protein
MHKQPDDPLPVEFRAVVLNTTKRARWTSHRWEMNFEVLDAEPLGPEPDDQTRCDHQSEELPGWVIDQEIIRKSCASAITTFVSRRRRTADFLLGPDGTFGEWSRYFI